VSSQPEKRLEDQIRILSKKLLLGAEGEDFHDLAAELRAAIAEHVKRMRTRLNQYPLADDRRSHG
jgi:hypothetical protein